MLNKTHIDALHDETLQPRHFEVLGISLRQFHLWLRQTGFEKKGKQAGKWRLFSPTELIALSTLRTLKGETDLSISKHPETIATLANHKEFALRVFEDWANGKSPFLISNLRKNTKVGAASDLLPGSILTVTMSLEPQIQTVFEAIKIGGTDRQRMTIEQLLEQRVQKTLT